MLSLESRISVGERFPCSGSRFHQMRKLPEAWFQLIREFEEKEGAFEAFASAWLTPDDDAFDRHPVFPQPRVQPLEGDGDLGADGKLPARLKPHAAFADFKGAVAAVLRIGAVVEE